MLAKKAVSYHWQACLGQTVNPADNTNAARPFDFVLDFKSVTEKVDKLQRLMKKAVMDGGSRRYLPNMLELINQGIIYNIKQKGYCLF